jgi:uncharacterized membrane protein
MSYQSESRSKIAALWIAILVSPALQAAGRQFLHGHVPDAVTASTAVGPLRPSDQMDLAVGLPLRNQEELNQLLKDLADPTKPNFRRYLTPAQFAERFGPSESDYQSLSAFFEANGLTVTATHPNRMIVDVRGTVADIESTFHVHLLYWRHPTRGTFFAPDREPSLDAGVTILDIAGLDNFVLPRPMDLRSRAFSSGQPFAQTLATGSGPAGLYIGNDFRNAYAPAVTLNGAGQSVGLFELGGFYASDVQANFQVAGLAPVPVQTVLLDNVSGQPGSTNVEITLDIMMAAYMAPGLSRIIVYEGNNGNDVLNRMVTDNLASQLSSSWTFATSNATTDQIFIEMIAQGQSMFQASGDSGAYHATIMPPADDPHVTVVGGTSLTTAEAGGVWESETAWPDSGGGVSATWPIPSYQQQVNTTSAGGSAIMRNIPDVAMIAAIQIFLICNDGQEIEVGGTSAAAPLWAGFMALANQQATTSGKPAVGFANPPLYAIGRGANYESSFHDITTGSNGYNALPGYDLATGWGTPAGQPLINELVGASSPASFALASSASTLSVAPGTSGHVTITISPQQGFSGAVALTVTGLPAGVTASFSPASATTTSTLTLAASASAASSTSTITITGTSGGITTPSRLVLNVTAIQAFAIAASATSVNLPPGGAATVTISAQNGFDGSVSLAASGLPKGVTAAFSTATPTKPGTLTLTASSSATLGTSTVLITATSGGLRSQVAINLTVSAQSRFAITAAASNFSIKQGASAASTITVVPQNGFDGTVALSATGVPYGVTATFSPMTALSSTLTFSVSPNASTGLSPVTITGTSGGVSSKVTIALTIAAQPRFTLGVTPASLSVNPGASATSTITIFGVYGFNDTVALAATGLPTGVTASFSTATAGKSVVTFSTAKTAAAGTSTVTITGTSGSVSAKVTIALTITTPGFTLAAIPGSVSITPGASRTSAIAILARYGFDGTVALSASGLPSGVTASFAAATADKTVVTFSVASTAALGTSTVTITGTCGSLSSKTTIALTISHLSTQ